MIYLLLFWEFFKIGALAFGGGYAMIAPVQDMVVSHSWMDLNTFNKFLGVCESTPGPIAINMATFVGSTQGGIIGSLCATLGAVLPAFLIMLLLSSAFNKVQNHTLFKATLAGIRPAALGLIVATGVWMVVTLAIPVISSSSAQILDWKAIVIMVILFAIPPIYKKATNKKFSSIGLIGVSAVLGMVLYSWM